MGKLKKIFITVHFGDAPEWMDKFEPPKGYDWIFETNKESFNERVNRILGFDYPAPYGSAKPWDYRPALGLLYEEELKGYDFWGHTDLDCVYGDTEKWVNDEFLSQLDVHSNHHEYINGCWSLYRNTPEVNNLFQQYPYWKQKMMYDEPNGWAEQEFSRLLEQSGLRYKYTFFQGWPYTTEPKLKKEGDSLYQEINDVWEEIMMFHFRRSKKWCL